MPKRMPEVAVDASIEVAVALMDLDGRPVLVVNPASGTFDSLLAAACRAVPDVHPDQVQVALRVAVGSAMPEAVPPMRDLGGVPRFTAADAKKVKREANLIVAVGLAVSVVLGAAVGAIVLVFNNHGDTLNTAGTTFAAMEAQASTDGPALPINEEGTLIPGSAIDPMLSLGPALQCSLLRPLTYQCVAPDGSVLLSRTWVSGFAIATLLSSGKTTAVVYAFASKEDQNTWRNSVVPINLPNVVAIPNGAVMGSEKAWVDWLAYVVRNRNGGHPWTELPTDPMGGAMPRVAPPT